MDNGIDLEEYFEINRNMLYEILEDLKQIRQLLVHMEEFYQGLGQAFGEVGNSPLGKMMGISGNG